MRTTHEVSRAKFYGTLDGRMNVGNGICPIGPCTVDIVVTQTEEEGKNYAPTYSVEIDGRHQYGGFADHLKKDGTPQVHSFGTLVPR